RAGHHPHAGPYLWRDPRPNRPSSGNSPIAKLGWIENENLLAGQYLQLANSNFNEVGTHGRNLIPDGSQTSFLNLRLRRDQRSTSEFRFKLVLTALVHFERCTKPLLAHGIICIFSDPRGPFFFTYFFPDSFKTVP